MPISEELKVVIRAEAKQAIRELKNVSKHTQEATGHFGGMAKSIQFLKSAAVIGAVTILAKKIFDLAGESQNDDLQPLVTIFSEIKSTGTLGESQKIKIQTSISQRNPDVTY